jgi:hypothetical protein
VVTSLSMDGEGSPFGMMQSRPSGSEPECPPGMKRMGKGTFTYDQHYDQPVCNDSIAEPHKY